MALRWTAADMLEAEQQFRKIIGYRDLATLVIAIERDDGHRHANPARTRRRGTPLPCEPLSPRGTGTGWSPSEPGVGRASRTRSQLHD
jgi:hypothetical protein